MLFSPPSRWCPKQRASRRTWSSPLTLCPPEVLCPVWIRTSCCSKPRQPPRSAAWESAWTSCSRPRAVARHRPSPRPQSAITLPPPVSLPRAPFQCCYWNPRPLHLLHLSCLSSPLLQSPAKVAKPSWGSWTVALVPAWWLPWTSMFVVNVVECCILCQIVCFILFHFCFSFLFLSVVRCCFPFITVSSMSSSYIEMPLVPSDGIVPSTSLNVKCVWICQPCLQSIADCFPNVHVRKKKIRVCVWMSEPRYKDWFYALLNLKASSLCQRNPHWCLKCQTSAMFNRLCARSIWIQ